MKKYLALLLCMAAILGLVGCGGNAEPATTEPGPEPTEKKDYSQWAGIVHDPKTWYEEFMALPVANENMTEDQLRKLCVDAFAANMTFHWTPNKAITYDYKLTGNVYQVNLEPGIAYSGLAYATGKSSGMVYKILKYYDKETGVLDVEAMDPNKVMSIVTSACARGAEQGWNRVFNSSGLASMDSFNQYDSAIIPVGPYTYVQADYDYDFGTREASDKIIAKNGDSVMYESYACMKPADGLYSSSSWHVMMCYSEPVVVRYSGGGINPNESYMLILEQEAVGTKTDKRDVVQENGVTLRQLGTVGEKFTFKKLYDNGYIPFTFKELIGEDPIEPGETWLGAIDGKKKEPQSVKEAFALTLFGNYALCTVDIVVKNPAGEILVTYDPDFVTLPVTYDVTLQGTLDEERVAPYANGKNTIHVYAQLANGEYLEAYSGVLNLD